MRWPRELFRIYWRRKSQGKPKTLTETIALIRKMAKENQLWGAERIRGELLKLGIEVSKRTIQRYMSKDSKEHSSSHIVPMLLWENWATFLKNQARNKHLGMRLYCCIQVVISNMAYLCYDGTENAANSTYRSNKYPSDEWTAQQLREATPWGKGARYLIRDRDRKYAWHFSAVAASIKELETA